MPQLPLEAQKGSSRGLRRGQQGVRQRKAGKCDVERRQALGTQTQTQAAHAAEGSKRRRDQASMWREACWSAMTLRGPSAWQVQGTWPLASPGTEAEWLVLPSFPLRQKELREKQRPANHPPTRCILFQSHSGGFTLVSLQHWEPQTPPRPACQPTRTSSCCLSHVIREADGGPREDEASASQILVFSRPNQGGSGCKVRTQPFAVRVGLPLTNTVPGGRPALAHSWSSGSSPYAPTARGRNLLFRSSHYFRARVSLPAPVAEVREHCSRCWGHSSE